MQIDDGGGIALGLPQGVIQPAAQFFDFLVKLPQLLIQLPQRGAAFIAFRGRGLPLPVQQLNLLFPFPQLRAQRPGDLLHRLGNQPLLLNLLAHRIDEARRFGGGEMLPEFVQQRPGRQPPGQLPHPVGHPQRIAG